MHSAEFIPVTRLPPNGWRWRDPEVQRPRSAIRGVDHAAIADTAAVRDQSGPGMR